MNNYYQDKAPVFNYTRFWLNTAFEYSNIREYIECLQYTTFEEFFSEYIAWHKWEPGYQLLGYSQQGYYKGLKAKCRYVFEHEANGNINFVNSTKKK